MVNPDLEKSESDLVFLGLDPTAGKRCGLTKVVLKGTLQATYWIIPSTGLPIHWDYPLGNIEITCASLVFYGCEWMKMAGTAMMIGYGRRLREKLRQAGAVSKKTAKTIDELGLSAREIRTPKRNVWIGKVKEVTDEKGEKRYYVPCEAEK